MKAELDSVGLSITGESTTERFAMGEWYEKYGSEDLNIEFISETNQFFIWTSKHVKT